MTRSILLVLGLLVLASFAHNQAEAQFYKGKTVTMIVNYPPGGPTDLEARITAKHLPSHIPGNPTIVIKNVGGGNGIIGSNQLGEAPGDGSAIGFFTLNATGQILDSSSMKTKYPDFVLVGGFQSPLVVYMRKDTPPGIRVPIDLMSAKDFRAISLNVQSLNTLNQTLALDLLGVKYQPMPAFRGLREVETAILQNTGQLANSSLSGWSGSVEPTLGHLVVPLWQLSAPVDGKRLRSKALLNLQTFEEFYTEVHPGKSLAGNLMYETLRTISDLQLTMFCVIMMPPKASAEAASLMRAAFVNLQTDPQFIADYSKITKRQPVLVAEPEGRAVLSKLGFVRDDVGQFLNDYVKKLTSR
jgi:hypothetical protein